jgi:tRNA(Ile)-lysidine synthase
MLIMTKQYVIILCMYEIIKRVTEYAVSNALTLNSGQKISCAVSGGADSMCMLDILGRLTGTYCFSIDVLHFNHKMRGEESDRDENFVHNYCLEHNLSLTIGHQNTPLDGSENAARESRYAFFEENASVVATAHNADDNAETMIANLTRGTGVNGLSGISPKITRASGLTVIRPVLCLTRKEITRYLEYNSIPHIEDSSNSDTRYSRNLIRSAVMPVLRQINPRIAEHAADTSKSLAEDERCLATIAKAFLAECRFGVSNPLIPRKKFNALDSAIASRVLILAAEVFGVSLFREHIRDMLDMSRSGKGGRILTLPKRLIAAFERAAIVFREN